jgi:hypothetical protein
VAHVNPLDPGRSHCFVGRVRLFARRRRDPRRADGLAPPAAIDDWRYAFCALVAGLVAFFTYGYLCLASGPVFLVVDAAGLAIFSITGARKALDFGLNPLAAILMAGVTASGGGAVRAVLLTVSRWCCGPISTPRPPWRGARR